MTPDAADVLRRSAAHVLVDDVSVPVLDEASAHHVFRVLRVRDGDLVSVTDGRGGWRLCRASGGAVEPDSEVAVEPGATDPVTIGFAIPKMDRPEWIVQKLTELGVERIVLLHAERSVVRWDDRRAEKHLAKLDRVAAEAMQQSRRVRLPEIVGPVAAGDFLVEAVAAEPGGRPLTTADRTVAVGPEGGWAPSELDRATATVTLGVGILRVETAALVAATQCFHHPT